MKRLKREILIAVRKYTEKESVLLFKCRLEGRKVPLIARKLLGRMNKQPMGKNCINIKH